MKKWQNIKSSLIILDGFKTQWIKFESKYYHYFCLATSTVTSTTETATSTTVTTTSTTQTTTGKLIDEYKIQTLEN
jgi:hypothetical protein